MPGQFPPSDGRDPRFHGAPERAPGAPGGFVQVPLFQPAHEVRTDAAIPSMTEVDPIGWTGIGVT